MTRPPVLMQVTPTAFASAPGGGERLAVHIDEALRQAAAQLGRPLDTVLLSLDAAAPVGGGLDRFQAIAGTAWTPRSVQAQALIERLALADIVHVHQCLTEVGLFVAAHARLLGKPVYGANGGADEAPLLAEDPNAAIVYDAVHAISEFAAASFQGMPVAVHVVPGPIDTGRFTPDGTVRDPGLVLARGRIMPHKGFERIIRALPTGMRLVIAGRPDDAAYLGFLRGLPSAGSVTFEHDLDDGAVLALLRRAGVFVQASTHQGYLGQFFHKPALLGLAPLEALACGTPTLVSDAGSLPELAVLPGCQVFASGSALAGLLGQARHSPAPADMAAAVANRHGLLPVGLRLLAMMGIAPCAS